MVYKELANTFDMPLASALWVNTAYLVLSAGSQLFFTMMCEVFSHGPVWIVAVVFTTIGTGICSGSMSLTELIIGRLIQGIGGGGAMSLCFVIMAESAPESIHSRYSCYILLTRLIGTIVGPIVGGLFVDFAHWTWAFYFNFIFCALSLLVIPFAVDLRVSKNIPLRKLRILDWSGASMAFLGPGFILVGLNWGGSIYRWNEWQTLMPIAVGAAIIVAMVFYESTWALHPQFGARVFKTRATVVTYVGCFLHGFVVSFDATVTWKNIANLTFRSTASCSSLPSFSCRPNTSVPPFQASPCSRLLGLPSYQPLWWGLFWHGSRSAPSGSSRGAGS
jgi:MFS family permease